MEKNLEKECCDLSGIYYSLKSPKIYNGLELAGGSVLIGLGAVSNMAYLYPLAEAVGFTFAYYGLDNLIG